MPSPDSSPLRAVRTTPAGRSALGMALLMAAGLGLLALSAQSLWIDELGTWRMAQAASLGDWFRQMLAWRNSDAQLPLFHLWMKAWMALFGTQEWVLRAANLPWLALALWPLWRAPVRADWVPLLRLTAGVLLLHPLVWYYLNEARPYVMLLAGACWAGAGLVGLWQPAELEAEQDLARHLLILGLAALAASSAIGAIWTPAFLLPGVVLALRQSGRGLGLKRAHGVTLVVAGAVVALVFAQYLNSFLSGVTATTLHAHKLVNFGYAFYELLGLAGLGPGRDALRVQPAAALRAQGLGLLLAAPLLLGALGLGLRALWREARWTTVGVLAAALLPVAVLLGLAELKHWRVVGRHMVPLLFFVALSFAAGARAAWGPAGRAPARAWVLVAGLALLGSALSIRWAERHQREQYREAAALAAQTLQQGGGVWWFAEANGPAYYGLGAPVQKLVPPQDYANGLKSLYEGMPGEVITDCVQARPGGLLILENPRPEDLARCPRPQRVLYSRRDTFDVAGVGERWLRAQGWPAPSQRLVGFEVWP